MKTSYIIAIAIITVGMMVTLSPQIESYIPPTNAIAKIASNDTNWDTSGGWYNATSSTGMLWITSDGSILIEFINYTGGVQ